MTYTVKHARSGLTAIAAVLAMSPTPLAAQDVTETPVPAAETTASSAPEAVPEPTAPGTTAAEPAAAEAEPPATTRRNATRTNTSPAKTRPSLSEPVRRAAPASAAPAIEATAEAVPLPPPAGATIDPGPMPVDETAAETTAAPADDALPLAAAAGLGLLALGGIGMAVGRRRKRKEEWAHQQANRAYLDSHPIADTPEPIAPAMTGPSAALADVPRTKLPPNFDLSRFGPHVRAAYLGPTEDNPSLSLKNRLRRAAAMDQQARINGEAAQETVETVRPGQPKQPMWKVQNDGFLLRPAGGKQPSKPAFQN